MIQLKGKKTGFMKQHWYAILLFVSGLFFGSSDAVLQPDDVDDLIVLKDSINGISTGELFEVYLKKQFYTLLDKRRQAYEQIKSQEDCKKWQNDRREFFIEQIGGFPERTPLNAKIVGELKGNGYRVEKVMYESRPNHHVTASLYLPDTEPPYPAVLVPCGHSHTGKAAGHYQRASILLARNGMAALCYDPIGQGERYQILDFGKKQTRFTTAQNYEVPHPSVKYLPTVEHTSLGLGCILLGSNVARYRIWDGMRSIDYLQSREDIIADKIGCTGNSGGGTLTAYLMALDERIYAAAPGCFLTTYRKLIDTQGPQDAEQNIYGQIAFGMDEPDYVIMHAPKPSLINSATRDATFDIEGTWDLFRQAKRFYTRMRYSERVDLIEADATHGFTILLREAAAHWMKRWLLGIDEKAYEVNPLPDPLTDEIIKGVLAEPEWTQEELYCSPEGQVMLMPEEKSVQELNSMIESNLKRERELAWKKLSDGQQRELVIQTIGAKINELTKPEVEIAGKIVRKDYTIEKIILQLHEGLPLPALAFVPEKPNGVAILYLHGESMKTDAQKGGAIEELVKKGYVVLAAELRGIGETETGHSKRDYGRGKFGPDSQEFFLAYLIGRSFVGMRVEDVIAWTRFLKTYKPVNNEQNKIHMIAIGETAIPALHAAALNSESFETVRLQKMIRSWAEIVSNPEGLNQAVNIVHGALRHYDLPDLIELTGKK
ncbi:acetylxylan esterase, partial [Bacteroidota bacterium]